MKKLVFVLSFISLGLIGCSSQAKEEKTYDTEFVTALAKGLDERWKESDQADKSGLDYSAEELKGYIQTELNKVEEFKDKKFKSTELQELALSYVNELNDGLSVADTYGADSFFTDWDKHVDERTSILVKINEIHEIPVKDKNAMAEVLAQGNEARANKDSEETIKQLANSFVFTLDDVKSDEFTKVYFVEAENTTEYIIKSLNLSINLVDENGTTIETTYVNANNWKPATKTRLEFLVFEKEFKTAEVTVEYYEVE